MILIVKSNENTDFFIKAVNNFTPISMEGISLEIENPMYLDMGIVNLHSLIEFVQNNISNDCFSGNPYSFPYVNLKITPVFFSHQREILCRKIFIDFYQRFHYLFNI